MASERIVVALAAINSPGYHSLANAYLRECLSTDPRLPEVWVADLEFTTVDNPYWIAYRILALDPAPELVGFSVYCWNARAVYDTARILTSARPGMRIVLGGPEVGPIAAQVLERHPFLFGVVRGEGEKTLPALVLSMSRGGDPESVPGLSVNTARGVVHGPEVSPVEPLDALPFPFTDAHPAPTDGSAYLETYRGCPHRCAYCFEAKGTAKIRSLSWERIERDIDRVASTPGITSLSFIDSVFNLTPERLRRLSDILAPHAERGLRLHTIEVDIERIDDEAASLLARAGVVSVETGPQTTGERALALTERSLDPDRYLAGVRACRDAGISVESDLIIGLPGDTVETVLESMRFAIAADPGVVQMSTLHVLPGTPLWDRAGEMGLVFDHEPPHEIISTADIGFAELRQLEVFGVALCDLYRARV